MWSFDTFCSSDVKYREACVLPSKWWIGNFSYDGTGFGDDIYDTYRGKQFKDTLMGE